MDRPPLWKGLKKLMDEESIQQLIVFAKKYGAVGMPVVISQTAEKHSDFSKLLYVEGRRTNRDTNFDYCIPGLDELLKRRSLQLSRLVWQAITSVEYLRQL